MRQKRQSFGPLGLSDLVTAETQNYATAKDAKSAKGLQDEAFRRNARSESGFKIGDLKFSDPKRTTRIPLCVLGALGGSNKCKFD